MWNSIPDTLLLDIFKYLDFHQLGRIAVVCKKWQRVAQDESLWKPLVKRQWKIADSKIAPGRDLWYNEYKRLYFHTPAIESEVLTQHTDEVLDVAFSHDGRFVSTTSKDCTVKVWKLGYPTTLRYSADMKDLLGWELTQYAAFNKTDEYLLVCGVNISDEYYNEFLMGHGAIFDMKKDFKLIKVMGMNPPHLFADWADEDICLGGFADNHDYLTINSFKVPDPSIDSIEKSVKPCPHDIIENTLGHKLCTFYADCNHTMNLLVANVPIKSDCDIDKNSNSVRTDCQEYKKYLIFVAGIHDCIILHELKNVRSERDFDEGNAVRPMSYEVIRRPLHYISGMKLSHDHRYLYINYREAETPDEEEDYIGLKNDIFVNVIDLQTRQVIPDLVYKGHKGFSEYPAWYICLDSSDDLVGSGSEEHKAYLWDKHYKCIVTTLNHREGVVNGLEFCPVDYETVVTSGDDHTIRIWRSRNRMKSLNCHKRES